MKYKSLIFDLDKTAVPGEMDGLPSEALISVVKKAKNILKISTASGRSVQNCRDIWKALGIIDPCIISGGSQVMDPISEDILWEEQLPEGCIEQIAQISLNRCMNLAINGTIFETDSELPNAATIIVVVGIKTEESEDLANKYSQIPNIAAHILPSWMGGNELRDIHLTHLHATKKHAVEKLLEILGVNKDEAIGVGDGNNDMPLFESVGYKVAMGNAQEALKNSADYITDTFDNDGLAKFIEEKIFKS